MIKTTTDEAVRTAAAMSGAKVEDLWAPWNDRGPATMADVEALLAKPHRCLDVHGTLQIWARGNAHVIEIHVA